MDRLLNPNVRPDDWLRGVGIPWDDHPAGPVPLLQPFDYRPQAGGLPKRCRTIGDALLAVALDPDYPTFEELP